MASGVMVLQTHATVTTPLVFRFPFLAGWLCWLGGSIERIQEIAKPVQFPLP